VSITHVLLLSTVLFSLNSQGFEKHDITEGLGRATLILHYPFDIGTLDVSGNNIHANHNGVTLGFDRHGDIGSYLFEYVEVNMNVFKFLLFLLQGSIKRNKDRLIVARLISFFSPKKSIHKGNTRYSFLNGKYKEWRIQLISATLWFKK